MPKIPFSKVSCSGSELKYIKEVLKSGWLTTAGKTQEFEKLFAQKIGVKYACAVNSCTAALHLGLEALNVKVGDKVFVPAMTFTASAEVIRYLHADPVILDVDYDTRILTPEILEKAIIKHPDVKVLIIVHFGGHPADMLGDNGILKVCKKNGIRIVEDAAHAFPTRIGNQMIGSVGDVTCFSFYANKTITTGEGGMLTTNNEDIYKRVKVMRLHGINRDIWDRFTSDKPSWEYDVVAPGYKYNMPDLNAAIGLAQLEDSDKFHMGRLRAVNFYRSGLQGIDGIDLPVCTIPLEDHAWHLFPIVLTPEANIERNTFIERMAQIGIGTSVHYKPLYLMSYYKERYDLKAIDFPNSERIWKGTVSLPLFPFMDTDDLSFICSSIKTILKEAKLNVTSV
ncbi:DegT/DnrJ/EryC1/StrS family aminotransferase [Ancylomarina sp.]|uniref:DegT/DnrJ/EryC1/StrS family aminotransferase n=1 Tax=Ancylomarina sp. TaxID=1970196 RepID=UPI003564B751